MSSSALGEHHSYLRDERRNQAYATALAQVVPPDAHVLDLGCGTGLLGLLTLAAGAARVDAVDASPMLEVAAEVAVANGRAGQVTHHQVWSTSLELPDKVDLVICDQADGIFGMQCGLADTFIDARDRLARPGAVLVPSVVTPLLVPVRVPTLRARLDSMHASSNGLDTGTMARRALASVWYVDRESIDASGEPILGAPIPLAGPVLGSVPVEGSLPAPPVGAPPWDGMLCGFRVELAPGVTISNVPMAADAIDRGGPILPFAAGEEPSSIDVRLYPKSGTLRWRLTTSTGTVERSSLDGLLDPALKARLDPSRAPSPTDQGKRTLALLTAADGTQSAAELRARLPEAHQGLLDTLLSDGYLA